MAVKCRDEGQDGLVPLRCKFLFIFMKTYKTSKTTAHMKKAKKILLITGDAGESFEILFASHRLREAGYIPVIAAPAVRGLNRDGTLMLSGRGTWLNQTFHLPMSM